jgi:hypothetical protein
MTKRALALSWFVLSFFAAYSCQSSPASSSPPAAATAAAKLAANQMSYSFPATIVGQVATSPMFELSATGSGSLIVASVTSSNPAEFPLAESGCIGKTLLAGATPCQVSVRFQPVTPGVRSAQVMVASSDGNSLALDVFGAAFASGSSANDNGGSGDGGGGGSGGGGGGGGSFPQAPCVPNTTGGIALSVINTTPFLIQVTLAGNTQVTAAVPPGAIQTLAIQPGNYTLTGEAPGSGNAIFIPSSWSVVNGCDYLLHIKASTSRPS